MASKLGLMRKQEAATDRLRSATNRLRARGVDVGAFPDAGRDRDLREVERVQHTATLLEACCDRIDELTAQLERTAALPNLEAALAGYGGLKNEALREELARRGIEAPARATKLQMVALLEEADAGAKDDGRADESEEPSADDATSGEPDAAGDSVAGPSEDAPPAGDEGAP